MLKKVNKLHRHRFYTLDFILMRRLSESKFRVKFRAGCRFCDKTKYFIRIISSDFYAKLLSSAKDKNIHIPIEDIISETTDNRIG